MLQRLQRIGLRRGFRAGSRAWLYIGIASWGLRTFRRLAERKPEVVLREELQPGERLILANARPTLDVEAVTEDDGSERRRGRRKRRRS